MAGATAQIDWKSDGSAAEATVDKLTKKHEQLARQLEKVKDASKKGAETHKKGLDDGTGAATRFAGALQGVVASALSIGTAFAAARAEYERLLAKDKTAADVQRSAGLALREARKAFTPDVTLRADQFDPSLERIAQKNRSNIETVAPVAQTVFSAKGDLTNAEALRIIETATEIAPTDAGEASSVGGRLADVMKAFGEKNPRAVAGFLAKFQQASRVTNMANVGTNLVPAVSALRMFGDTAEEGAEVTATLNQLLQDETGAQTRTTVVSMGAQLQKFLPKLEDTQARISALQNDPKLREQFLKKASFEQASAPFVKSLLSGDAAAVAAMQAARGGISALGPQSVKDYEDWLAFVNGGGKQALVEAEQQGAANVQGKRLADTPGGLRAQARQEYERVLTEVEEGAPLEGFADWLDLMRFDKDVRRNRDVNPARVAREEVSRIASSSDVTPSDREFAKRQLEVLESLDRKWDEMLVEQRRQTRALESGGQEPRERPPAAAALGRGIR